MGILDKFFGDKSTRSNTAGKELDWIPLIEDTQLDEILDRSFKKPQLIYKHSTTCGISSMVLNVFTKGYEFDDHQAQMYFLDIHRNRDLSNNVATKFQVRHESPQLIVLNRGEVKAHASHGAIVDLDIGIHL